MDILYRKLVFLVCLGMSTVLFGHGGSTDAISKGFDWITHQQQADGSITSEQDIALPFQATSEATIALSNHNSLDQVNLEALKQYVLTNAEPSSEFYAKLLTLKLKLGESIDEEETALLALQNLDGGFGHKTGFDSTVFDTAYVLHAIALTTNKNSQAAGQAIAFLLDQQNADGSFEDPSYSTAFLTSYVVRALQPYLYTFNISDQITQARDFLYSKVENGADWPSDWEAAQFLLAVVPLTTDVDLYKPSLEWLTLQQFENGSWQNDVYSTALTLQALYLSANITFPTSPDTALVKGKLIDGDSGQALPAVEIGISPDISTTIMTDEAGVFTIPGLQPNTYTLSYQVPGYVSSAQTLTTKKGQLIDLGAIVMQIAPTTAVVSGTIMDGTDNVPVANALVEITLDQTVISALTDAQGSYSLTVPAGNLSLKVTAEGYYPASASVGIEAGTKVRFSPPLRKLTEDPLPLELTGRVIDLESQQTLSGVTVHSHALNTDVVTDAQGSFTFTGLTAGEQSFEFSQTGYQGVITRVVLPDDGKVDLGTVALKKVDELETTKVSGQVLDADTGLGVEGASISIAGQTVLTDALGYYEVSGIQVLEFDVSANASGFVFSSVPVTLASHGNITVNIDLYRADIAGISVDRVDTNNTSYEAYQQVQLSAIVSNQTVRERGVRLYVLVQDAQGNSVDSFPAVDIPLLGDSSDPESLAHYEQHLEDAIEKFAPNETRMIELEMSWNTGRQIPGQYSAIVQALDSATSQVLSEFSTSFDVVPTQKITSVHASVTPGYALLDSSPELGLVLNLKNASNQLVSSDLQYQLLSPTGQIINQGMQSVQLAPAELTKEVQLPTFVHQFSESGDYQLKLTTVSGTAPQALVDGYLFVPPTVRLDVTQDVLPEKVLPGGKRTVEVQINVQGKDGE